MDDLSAHVEYMQNNPHPGALLMAVLESFNGESSKKNKPKNKRTPEEQKQSEQEQLQGLLSQFGNCGPKPKRKLVDYVC